MRMIFFSVVCLLLAGLTTGCSLLGMELCPVKERAVPPEAKRTGIHDYNPSHYPVTVQTVNSHGELEQQVFTKPPERIIAMWQNSIETPLALGLGDRILAGVGVPDKKYFSPQYQEAYSKIPIQGSRELDVETTVLLEPDILIGWFSTFEQKVLRSTDFWHSRGVNTYIAISSSRLHAYRKLEHEWQDIRNLGKIFDRNERAEEIVAEMQQEISSVVEQTSRQTQRPRALIMEYNGREVHVYGEKTLAGDITKLLQGDLLAPQESTISVEQVVDMDPDVIFVLVCEWDYGREDKIVERVTNNPAMQHLRCVQNKRVLPLHLGSVYAAGVRSLDGIRTIARGMYPDVKLRRE